MNIEKDIDKILKIVERKFNLKLPKQGIFAGQALASAIYEFYNIKYFNTVYNDIDLFFLSNQENKENNIYIKNSKINYSDFYLEVVKDYNGVTLAKNINNNYVLDYSTNIGFLNYIYVKNTKNNCLNVKLIVDSFDINAVQIGYDLEKKQLYYTQDFFDFLNTQQLKIITYRSPYHSILRYHKKIEEIGIDTSHFSIEEESIKIATTIDILNNIVLFKIKNNDFNKSHEDFFNANENIMRNYFPSFGKKYFNMYNEHSSIHNYFDLIGENKNQELYRLTNIIEGNKDIVNLDLLNNFLKKHKNIKNSKENILITLEEFKLLNLNYFFEEFKKLNKKEYFNVPEIKFDEPFFNKIEIELTAEEKKIYLKLFKLYNKKNYSINNKIFKEVYEKNKEYIDNINSFINIHKDLEDIINFSKTKMELLSFIFEENIDIKEYQNCKFYYSRSGNNFFSIDKKNKKLIIFKEDKSISSKSINIFISGVISSGYEKKYVLLKDSNDFATKNKTIETIFTVEEIDDDSKIIF